MLVRVVPFFRPRRQAGVGPGACESQAQRHWPCRLACRGADPPLPEAGPENRSAAISSNHPQLSLHHVGGCSECGGRGQALMEGWCCSVAAAV